MPIERRASFASNQTVWRRLGPKGVGLALVVAAFVMLRASPSHRNHFGWTTTSVLAAVSFFVMLALVLRGNPYPRLVPAPVTANERELVVGHRRVPCDRIRSAVFVPGEGPGKPFVRVMPKLGLPIEIAVASSEEGAALLRALGFDAESRAIELRSFSLRFFTFGTIGATVLAMPLMLAFHPSAFVFMGVFGVMMALAFVLALGIVSVGADGIAIRRWGRTRFIETESIEDVRREKLGVTIRKKDGEEVNIALSGGSFQKGETSTDVAAFIERIEEAMRVHRSGALESAGALLGRGSHDVRAWVSRLRALGEGSNVTLRTAAIGPEQLVRVVESPAARPIDRAAAAVAIQSSGDEEAKARVRVAVDATADDELRAALDAAAEGDDERIAAALGALDERANTK